VRHLHAGHADGGEDLLSAIRQAAGPRSKTRLGGVLCRCTGYGKIVEAMMDVVAIRTRERAAGRRGGRRASAASTVQPR
jgi:xanthine dehydrogenase iron-sulfur cluster and FAD-binding subunit A